MSLILFASPRYTYFNRGSSPEHPLAIDFGWLTAVAGSQNQPLYSATYGADKVTIARIRSISDGGNVVDLRIETPENTIYRSYMHMKDPCLLPVGTDVTNRRTVVGYMGNTGASEGNHVHEILAICPKGTPVESMYDYRVDPEPHIFWETGWHQLATSMPEVLQWREAQDTPSTAPGENGATNLVNLEIKGGETVGALYKLTQTGNKMIFEKQGLEVGDVVVIKSTATKYATGQAIPQSIKKRKHTIMEIGKDRVLLKEIMSWVYTKDVEVF